MNCCPYRLNGGCGNRVLSGEADCPLAIRDLAVGQEDVEIVQGCREYPIAVGPLRKLDVVLPVKMVDALNYLSHFDGCCRSGIVMQLLSYAFPRSHVGPWPIRIDWKTFDEAEHLREVRDFRRKIREVYSSGGCINYATKKNQSPR